MTFSYKDNKILIKYINKDTVLVKLAGKIAPWTLLIKLYFEISYIPFDKYKNIPIQEENFQNEKKKFKEEINDRRIIQLNRIIQEKKKF